MEEHKDLSEEKIIELMQKLTNKGIICYVKWTCKKCGERVTCSKANAFFTKGYTHEEKEDGSVCGYTTFPDKYGLMSIVTNSPDILLKEDQDEDCKL